METVVQTVVEDQMVVDKVLASRMSTRKVPKNLEGDKPSQEEREKQKELDFETIEVEEFFVKYKLQSYIHCDWKTAEELELGDKRVAAKIRRFRQKKDASSNVMDFLEDEAFNPDYCEVDRILDVAEHWVHKDQLKKVCWFVRLNLN